jgi:hypothetical protein
MEPDWQTGTSVQRVQVSDKEDEERRLGPGAARGGQSRAHRWKRKSALRGDITDGRGDMENRIKEQFSLFADRVSAETMRANQMRLYLSTMSYILVSGLRRLGLKGTELAEAQVSTIRTKLLKIGAQIRVTVRKVWISMASSYPWQKLYQQVWANLRC